MSSGSYFSSVANKVKGICIVLIGILLIWESYIYWEEGRVQLHYFPFYRQVDMVKSRQKKNDIIKHLLHACKEMKTKNATQFQNVPSLSDGKWLVSERFKLMACKIYKVGSTNTARILYALDHMSENTDSYKVKGSRARHNALLDKINNSKENMESQFSSYTKFLFIRQPLERLMSAYQDRRPRSWFRQNKMTFNAYLEKILTITDNEIDLHMVTFTRMCNPCQIQYDFIGLMDSFEEDMAEILKSVGADKLVTLPHRNQTGYEHNETNVILQDHVKEVPKPLIKRIYQKYYWDYFLFGFAKPDS